MMHFGLGRVKEKILAYLCTKTCIECDNIVTTNWKGAGGSLGAGGLTCVIGQRESRILAKVLVEPVKKLLFILP